MTAAQRWRLGALVLADALIAGAIAARRAGDLTRAARLYTQALRVLGRGAVSS